MLHLLIDTSVWLDLAERRDGQRWIVPLRVLLFQRKLELMVPALAIDEFDRNRPRREDALTKSVVDRLRQFRRDLRSFAGERDEWGLLDQLQQHVPLVNTTAPQNFREIAEMLRAGTTLVPTEREYSNVVQRGLSKKAPFSYGKNSVADAMLIELYATQLRHAGPGDADQPPVAVTRDDDGVLLTAGDITIQPDPETGKRNGALLENVTDAWEYNPFGEMNSHRASVTGTQLYHVSYDRDRLGRIIGIRETIEQTDRQYAYDYDDAGRLRSATIDGVAETYSYDTNGNRTGVTTSSGTTTATCDDTDRLLTQGSLTVSHGPEGEVTEVATAGADTTRYTYDSFGYLTRVDLENGTQVSYTYDAAGRRVARDVNGSRVSGLLYDRYGRVIAQLDPAGAIVATFIYAGFDGTPAYLAKGGQSYRIVADHLGSARLVVNAATGEVAQRIDYDAWGLVVNDTGPGFQPFGFAGGLYDPATGLTRFGVRDYSPILGQWLTREPGPVTTTNTNAYRYANADPVNRFDPDGRAAVAVPLALALAAAIGEVLILTGALISAGYLVWVIYSAMAKKKDDVRPVKGTRGCRAAEITAKAMEGAEDLEVQAPRNPPG